MKFLKIYLIITSVLLHLAIILSLFWVVPFVKNALSTAEELKKSNDNAEFGIVEDICEIQKDDLKYHGYKIKYKDQILYASGKGNDDFKSGESVKVLINPHPYAPIHSLIVTICKKQ